MNNMKAILVASILGFATPSSAEIITFNYTGYFNQGTYAEQSSTLEYVDISGEKFHGSFAIDYSVIGIDYGSTFGYSGAVTEFGFYSPYGNFPLSPFDSYVGLSSNSFVVSGGYPLDFELLFDSPVDLNSLPTPQEIVGFSGGSLSSQNYPMSNGNYFVEFWNGTLTSVSVVSEPSTYMLMFGGLGLVGFMASRRRKSLQQ